MANHEISFTSQSVTKAAAIAETLDKVEVMAWIDRPGETAIYANIKGFGRKKLAGLSDANYPVGGLTATTLAALDTEVKSSLGVS